ncbi:TonB-dependent receptor [Parapedobacter lycopersici]|uniref:TonB-dependent receptor n=1 Tax=Parapedobacter lycopersici TaxID=1864939 RepID=UPI00214D2362|nr:TonB-dependent receptor [Parapedobacter lycopersici]
MIKNLIATGAFFVLMGTALAQHSLTVEVVSNENDEVLSGASVQLTGTLSTVHTDQSGLAVFRNVAPGTYEVQVSFVGFHTQAREITVNDDEQTRFSMRRSNVLTDEVIVQATRASEQTATTYKNISKEDIAKNNIGQDLPFLLNQTPSVVVSSDAGAGVGYTGMSIRGSDATRVNVTINGIPLNDSESMAVVWVNMADFASSVDNIQIQRGVGTSTNGAGAFGGSINIQTTTLNEDPYAELDNSFGSYNTLKNTVRLGTGLINNKFSFDGRLSRVKSDGYIDRASSDLKSFFLSGAWHGERSLLRANVFSGKERTYQAWNGVPEALLATDRTYNEFTYEGQTDNYTQTHYQLHYSNALADNLTLNTALHYTRGAGYYEEYREDDEFKSYGLEDVTIGGETITATDLVRRRWLDNHFYGLTYSLNYQTGVNLNLTLGGAYNEYRGKHFGEVIWAQYASNSALGDRYYEDDAVKKDFNIFGKAEYRIDQLNLFADFQYRRVAYTFLGFDRNLIQLDQTDYLNFFNPKVGVSYQFDNNSNVYASLAIGNKEPIRKDYTESSTNSRPRPERLKNVEAGYRITGRNFNLGANGYAMLYRDQLIVTGQINDVGSAIRQNVPDSYRLGLELDGQWQPVRPLTWSVTAAVSRNKIRNFTEYVDLYDYQSQQEIFYKSTNIAMSPSFVGSSELAYQPFTNAEIALISKYVSRQYLDNTSTVERSLDAFFVNNVRLAYNMKFKGIKNVGLTLLINNIFNEKYEANGYTWGYINEAGAREHFNYYFPQATANFLLGLNLKF